ncbi:MAG: transglycosylase SLT domain-containing protein [Desulfobacteraceae bacterium]|nr:transglycosylase SLT domain-containing protein [Desulfobacteraceae bacterium]
MKNKRPVVLIIFSLLSLIAICGHGAASEMFPPYDCLADNISFWISVFTEYRTDQGIIHDSADLSIVYEVIDILPYEASGNRTINRALIKEATSRYKKILKDLARDPQTGAAEHRRVAAVFNYSQNPRVYKKAFRRVRCQFGQKDRFKKGIIRSKAYLNKMYDIFKSYGLPKDLALLAHVESSFDIDVYSKYGAAGVWQFTHSTGKRFLKIGYVVDERLDPIKATHAAAKFLKKNYALLESWPLAISAYNHGTTGIKKAKIAHGDYPSIFKNYHSRSFKFASRNFYSEFLAARYVAKNYRHYFGKLLLDSPRTENTLTLRNYAHIKDLSKHFNIRLSTLKNMNPDLREPVFNGEKFVPKGYILRLPAVNFSHITGQKITLPSHIYKSKQKTGYTYTVQRGDTAWRIAQMHQVKLNDLILANNLNLHGSIYPRQSLYIPQTAKSFTVPEKRLAFN